MLDRPDHGGPIQVHPWANPSHCLGQGQKISKPGFTHLRGVQRLALTHLQDQLGGSRDTPRSCWASLYYRIQAERCQDRRRSHRQQVCEFLAVNCRQTLEDLEVWPSEDVLRGVLRRRRYQHEGHRAVGFRGLTFRLYSGCLDGLGNSSVAERTAAGSGEPDCLAKQQVETKGFLDLWWRNSGHAPGGQRSGLAADHVPWRHGSRRAAEQLEGFFTPSHGSLAWPMQAWGQTSAMFCHRCQVTLRLSSKRTSQREARSKVSIGAGDCAPRPSRDAVYGEMGTTSENDSRLHDSWRSFESEWRAQSAAQSRGFKLSRHIAWAWG